MPGSHQKPQEQRARQRLDLVVYRAPASALRSGFGTIRVKTRPNRDPGIGLFGRQCLGVS